MNLLRFLFSLSLVAFAQQKEYRPKEEKLPGPPVAQPIAYSHKIHAGQLAMKCTMCHTIPATDEGFKATFPKEAVCMGCHSSIKKESPEIQKLAAFVAKKQPVPWERVYRLPDIVWFSHSVHVKEAKVECAVCHGAVAERDVLFQEKSVAMLTCMACHAQHKAANGCDTCHSSQ
jgi:predicted CXXCH cytochrome family protein